MCFCVRRTREMPTIRPQQPCFDARRRIGCGIPQRRTRPMRERISDSFRRIFATLRLKLRRSICMPRMIGGIRRRRRQPITCPQPHDTRRCRGFKSRRPGSFGLACTTRPTPFARAMQCTTFSRAGCQCKNQVVREPDIRPHKRTGPTNDKPNRSYC